MRHKTSLDAAPAAPRSRDTLVGQEIGNWVLEAPIGSGGMGKVYRARHRHLDTLAAVKVLRPHLIDETEMQQRFQREAATQARLRHPHVARIYDYQESSGAWFLVMEFLDHGSVADRIRTSAGPVPIEDALEWTRQALDGLAYAHRQGVIHRDIKPENLLFDAEGRIRVADFGIARDLKLTRMTQTGMALGTPHYMSPEQLIDPGAVDHRVDVYSVGVVLYETLSGKPPFEGSSFIEVSRAQLQDEPPPLSRLNTAVTPALEAVIRKALAKDPEKRFSDCDEFREALERLEAGSTGSHPWMDRLPQTLPPPVPTTLGAAAGPMEPPPLPRTTDDRRSGWRAATFAMLFLLLLGAAAGWWFLASPGPEEAETVSDLLQQAARSEIEAETASRAADAAVQAAEEALSGAREVLREPATTTAGEKLAAANFAISQGQKALDRAREASEKTAAAHEATLEAARRTGADLDQPPPAEPRLATVISRPDTPEAETAIRSAVEVARLAKERAHGETSQAEDRLQEAEKIVEEAEQEAEETARRARDDAEQAVEQARRDARQAVEQAQREAEETVAQVQREAEKAASEAQEKAKAAARREAERLAAGARLGGQRPGPGSLPVGPLPEQPKLAVLAFGDAVLAGSFEQELERRLRRARFDVQDEHNSLEVSRQLRQEIAPADTELMPALVKAGFHVLVVVRVEEGERRRFELRGQHGSLVGARLRMNAYLLLGGSSIGRGWSDLVEYTELSAQAKAKRALLRETSELATNIRGSWKHLRESRPPGGPGSIPTPGGG